jgi:hypothetical protein
MANNLIQVKRTSVSGRAANTTTLPNPGELALNMTDGILYSTNGSAVFEIGANNTNTRVTNAISVGNTSVNATINSTSFSGTANNASNLGGVAAANYLQNTGSYTISGTRTHTANLEVRGATLIINSTAAVMANGSNGTSGQLLASNGSSVYWKDDMALMYAIALG